MKLFVDNTYQEFDPGCSSSAESSSSSDDNTYRLFMNSKMSAPRVLRGSSEPPIDYHVKTGLKKSCHPIKLAGVTMGSQENLVLSDDEGSKGDNPYSVFGKRLRRSVTPLRTLPCANEKDITSGQSYNIKDASSNCADPRQ